MRVLVTGGAGFIGFHLVRRLLRDGHEVTALDNLNDYYNPALKRARVEAIGTHTAFRFVRMDLTEQEGVLQLFREKPFALVVNLAAQPGVRHSIDNLKRFPFIEDRLTADELTLHGAWFSIAEGALHWLDPRTQTFDRVE